MEELKPCPFCGSTNLKQGYVITAPVIECGNCHAISPNHIDKTEEDIIEAWNTRYERTCHASDLYDNVFECSECGCMDTDGIRNYCPDCGAKVIEE